MTNKIEQQVIQALQANLPLVKQPFEIGISEAETLAIVQRFQENQVIRRFGAVLYHQRLGFVANGMGVWRAAEDEIEKMGAIMARFPEVSHCYYRPASPKWKYNLYTMIHGPSQEACRQVARRISEKTGLSDYKLLFSSREFKKISMVYYSGS